MRALNATFRIRVFIPNAGGPVGCIKWRAEERKQSGCDQVYVSKLTLRPQQGEL